jgi:hypothetical protein
MPKGQEPRGGHARYGHTGTGGGTQDRAERKDAGWRSRQGRDQSQPDGRQGEPEEPRGTPASTPPPGTPRVSSRASARRRANPPSDWSDANAPAMPRPSRTRVPGEIGLAAWAGRSGQTRRIRDCRAARSHPTRGERAPAASTAGSTPSGSVRSTRALGWRTSETGPPSRTQGRSGAEHHPRADARAAS